MKQLNSASVTQLPQPCENNYLIEQKNSAGLRIEQ